MCHFPAEDHFMAGERGGGHGVDHFMEGGAGRFHMVDHFMDGCV